MCHVVRAAMVNSRPLAQGGPAKDGFLATDAVIDSGLSLRLYALSADRHRQ